MFYHAFILQKKGPLARVWLAAHWEKKLSKALVFETDVQLSVESIISPKLKMALRTSGHLLLGVVRIYSRKAKYLLADCTEAFVKIKMAFRPGVVDLPEDSRELAMSAVTLPEIFSDLDMTLPELNDVEIQAQFTLNQSRIEEITMKEDLVMNNFIGDDAFGDIPFDQESEKEILRAGSLLEDSLHQENDASKITLDKGDQKDLTDSTLERSKIDIALDEPIKDDGFGGDGMDFLADGFGDELGPGLDDFSTSAVVADVTLGPVDINLGDEAHTKDEKEKESPVVEQDQEPGVNETANETTLLHNEAEAFVLEPVEIGQKEKKSRRKRKLIVDDEKILATEVIKAQLADASDIVKPATLAPPTKRRMKVKMSSVVEKLFSQPGVEFFASILLEEFTENLTNELAEEPDAPESDDKMELDEPELGRDAVETSDVHETSKLSSVSLVQEGDKETTTHSEPQEHTLEEEHRPYDEDPFVDMGDNDILPNGEDLAENGPEPELPASQMNEQQLSTETDEQFESRRWTKRTQQVLHTLKREFKKKDLVNFNTLCVKTNRKHVAYKFYSCLLLSKEGSIEAHQKSPFGSIQLTQGPRFEEAC